MLVAMSAAVPLEMPVGTQRLTGTQSALVYTSCWTSGELASATSADRRGCPWMDAEATVLNRSGLSGSWPGVVAIGVKHCTSCTEHGVLDNFICISAARGLASRAPPCFLAPLQSEASASCWEGVYKQPARQAKPPWRQSGLLELRLLSSA